MNRTILTGNITRDLELRYTPGGAAVCEVTIANNDMKDKSIFVACVAWNKTAETMSQYLHKGSRIAIEGRITQDEWDDRETGKKRSKTKVLIDRFEFLDKKVDSQYAPPVQAPSQQPTPQPLTDYTQTPMPTTNYNPPPMPDAQNVDTDIPF
jgi:single-strand DNA-binding protein